MAKKIDYNFNKNIISRNIAEICKEHMLIFGANNNIMRHIPFLADGLKPGERRILFTMFHEMGLIPSKKRRKVAKIAGNVIGDYHPHGDQPVVATLVKLAQPWGNIQIIIDGGGNYGSPMGDPAANMRYIEARLSKYAYKCFFEEFSLDMVNTKPNFDREKLEPEYLPSRYPNVLINNSFGIGYGTRCGIPTYNLREVLELTKKLIEDPMYEDITLIPDSPTGADIIDEGQFKAISEEGTGTFKMRGVIDIDEERNCLIIRNTPLQVYSGPVKEAIIELFEKNQIPGIKYIDDESTIPDDISDGNPVICIKIFLKAEVDPVTVKHLIYTKTDMQKTFSVNFRLIDDYVDKSYNIRSILLEWIEFRRETKRRIYNSLIMKNRERQHVLDTILMIFAGKNGEKALQTIRNADNRQEVVDFLMSTFSISSLQAKMIADMRLTAFTKDSIRRYQEEKKVVDENVNKYEKIARSQKKIDKIIVDELDEGIQLFGNDRKSRIVTVDGELKVRNTNHIVVFTMNGMVKKLPDDVKTIGSIGVGDYPIEITQCSNLTDLLIFDQTGYISKLPVSSIRPSELTSYGERLSTYCNIRGRITSIVPRPTDESLEKIKVPVYFVMFTRNGIIKKTMANKYTNIKNELLALVLKDDDELQGVKIMAGDQDILIYTNKGYGVRIPSVEIKETNRMSIGVKALELSAGEVVIGADIVNQKDKFLFCLTNKGTGKKCTLENFQTMTRASKPLRIISLDDGEEVILIRTVKGTEKFKAYLKSSIEQINIEDVIELPRLSKGKKLIPVRKGENIIDIKEIRE